MLVGQSRILLVDSQPIVRRGLAVIIDREMDLTVCGEAADISAGIEAALLLKPELAVIDISLNRPDSFEILRDMRATNPALRVLILSTQDDTVYAERALRAGAQGYLMKQEDTRNILVAIRRILGGEVYVSDRVASKMLKRFGRDGCNSRRGTLDRLTEREMEVFRLIGEGRKTRQISEKLHVSVKTVETYQAHIKAKMGLHNGHELTDHARRWAAGQTQPAETSVPRQILGSVVTAVAC